MPRRDCVDIAGLAGAVLLAGVGCAMLSGCDGFVAAASMSSPLEETAPLPERLPVRIGQWAWEDAALRALDEPTAIELPYAEWGGFLSYEPNARAMTFDGLQGQRLEIALALPEPEAMAELASGAVSAELFAVDETRPVRLARIELGNETFAMRLPKDGSYIVRLVPEANADAIYHLTLELGAALSSPLRGYAVRESAVNAFFGARRDGGARHHEGVDIFAPRRTPVLAVADGTATYRVNDLGGHSVWVNAPGVSYYYAHLERVAVGGGQRVKAGDIIGYVGNSGNAHATAPHLHFGVYEWGKNPIDPLPLLQSRRFEDIPGAEIEPTEPQTLWRSGCAARFPDSLSSYRVCLALSELIERPHRPASGALCAAAESACAQLSGGGGATLAWHASSPARLRSPAVRLPRAPTPAVLEVAAERSDLDCGVESDGLPALCPAERVRHLF